MKIDLFLSKSSNLFAENRLLKLVLIVLVIITAINSYISYRAMSNFKVVLIPPSVNGTIEVKGNNYSRNYLASMGKYITYLAFNYSPATARAQFDELLQMYAPEDFAIAKSEYYATADHIEKNSISSVFQAYGNVIVENQENNVKITVTGQRRIFRDNITQDTTVVVYDIDAVIDNGRLYVKKIKESSK